MLICHVQVDSGGGEGPRPILGEFVSEGSRVRFNQSNCDVKTDTGLGGDGRIKITSYGAGVTDFRSVAVEHRLRRYPDTDAGVGPSAKARLATSTRAAAPAGARSRRTTFIGAQSFCRRLGCYMVLRVDPQIAQSAGRAG